MAERLSYEKVQADLYLHENYLKAMSLRYSLKLVKTDRGFYHVNLYKPMANLTGYSIEFTGTLKECKTFLDGMLLGLQCGMKTINALSNK